MATETIKLGIELENRDYQKVKSKLDAILKDADVKIDADINNALKDINKVDSALNDIDAEITLDLDTTDADKKINSLSNSFSSFAGGFAGAFAGTAIIGGLSSVIESAGNTEQSLLKLQAQTGQSREEVEELNKVAKQLFQDGVGESVDEVRQGLGTATKQLKAFLSPEEIAEFTKGAGAIAQTFDMDINEVIGKSRTFIQQFGLDAEESLNLLSVGMQEAGNVDDDLLDTLNEYSAIAKEAGLSAEDFTGILINGVQAGARNTDLLGDAIKEAGILIRDGSFKDAFKGLSESATESEKDVINTVNNILANAQAGDISIVDAIGLSAKAIQDGTDSGQISDAIAQQLQVAIAGTKPEDIGINVYSQAFSVPVDGEAIKERGAEASAILEESIQPKGFEGLKRTFETLIGDVANALLPALQPILDLLNTELIPLISEIFNTVAPIIGQVVEAIKPLLQTLTSALLPILQSVFKVLEPVLDVVVELINTALEPLIAVLEPVLSAITPIIDILAQLLSIILPLLTPLLKLVGVFAQLVISINPLLLILEALTPLFEQFAVFLEEKVVPVIDKFVGTLVEGVDKLASWLGLNEEVEKQTKKVAKEVENNEKAVKDLSEATEENNKIAENNLKQLGNITDATVKDTKAKEDNRTALEKLTDKQKELNKLLENAIFDGDTESAKRYAEQLEKVDAKLESVKLLEEFISQNNDLGLDQNIELPTNELDTDAELEKLNIYFDEVQEILGQEANNGLLDSVSSNLEIFNNELQKQLQEGTVAFDIFREIGIRDIGLLSEAFTGAFNSIDNLIKENVDNIDAYASVVSDTAGLIAGALGEQTALGKAFAITQAVINSYLAFTQTIADPTIPTFIKIPTAGIILASGLAQVSQIAGAQTGVIGINENYSGRVGERDTIPLMVARGESVITEKGTLANIEALELANKGINLKDHYYNQFASQLGNQSPNITINTDLTETNELLYRLGRTQPNIKVINKSQTPISTRILR